MLYRDNRSLLSLTSSYSTDKPVTYKVLGHGQYKWLSARNDTGVFRPGTFRANPVSIGTSVCVSSPVQSISGKLKIGSVTHDYSCTGNLAGYLGFTTGNHPAGISEVWDNMLASGSLTKAYAKASAPDFDLGVNLGELRETLEGLANPISGLRKFVTQMNKLREKSFKAYQTRTKIVFAARGSTQALTMLGSSWLEWRMGIYPLLKTIEELLEHLKDQNDLLLGKLVRVKASVKRVTSGSKQGLVTGPGMFQLRGREMSEITTRYTSGIYFRQQSPLDFGQMYGTDWSSAPAVLWELVRLSFVVDRFIRIGEFLQSLRYDALGNRTTEGTVTSAKISVVKTTFLDTVQVTGFPQTLVRASSVYSTVTDILIRRVNLARPALPALNFDRLKWKQQLDHLALLWQNLPKVNWYDQIRLANLIDQELKQHYNPRRPYIDPINRKFNK